MSTNLGGINRSPKAVLNQPPWFSPLKEVTNHCLSLFSYQPGGFHATKWGLSEVWGRKRHSLGGQPLHLKPKDRVCTNPATLENSQDVVSGEVRRLQGWS